MLNLNYNINKALGGGGCIGVMKYNYSASIVVGGGGGGGATGGSIGAGGGGGAGMVVSQSISIIPNLIYQINVGAGGAVDSIGQDSYLTGWDDNDTFPIAFYAGGGKNGTTAGAGGNSGTGSIVRATSTTLYPGFTGGTLYSGPQTFGPQYGAGGGASNSANGNNGADAQGAQGATGYAGGGGGGANFVGPSGPYGNAGQGGAGAPGNGGNGYSTIQNQLVNPRAATAGGNGFTIISYTGKTKALVTGNVTTTYDGATTTHTFGSGSSTFQYIVPYPWEEQVIPYQVQLCPPTYR